MSKINRKKLVQIIQEELSKALEEDALVTPTATQNNMYRKSPNIVKQPQKCSQCGHNIINLGDECSECGYVESKSSEVLKEDCGCGSCDECGDDSVVLFKHHGGSKHEGAYMAKSQLYKTANYAQKLYYIIPDNHNLQDWMRTKLAQISDDISEVYHALEHDLFEGDV
tara:strand:+ start:2929 stop:3432 length:504 start_codon:yes stop_codon:yes gene_type:complete